MKRIEKFKKLLEVQESLGGTVDLVSPTRELLREGKIVKISARSGDHQDRYLFLVRFQIINTRGRVFILIYWILKSPWTSLTLMMIEVLKLFCVCPFYSLAISYYCARLGWSLIGLLVGVDPRTGYAPNSKWIICKSWKETTWLQLTHFISEMIINLWNYTHSKYFWHFYDTIRPYFGTFLVILVICEHTVLNTNK